MLQFYLSSVVIYAIINLSVSKIFKDKLLENLIYLFGENTNRTKLTNKLVNLFVFSVVPVLRLYFIGSVIWIATAKKEALDKLKANVKNK